MSRVVINLDALRHNVSVVGDWMEVHGASWIAVIKALCGHEQTLQAMQLMGVSSIGDSRLDNLRVAAEIFPDVNAWYLRGPSPASAPRT